MRRKMIQLSESVWLWPHHPDPTRIEASVGIIARGHSSILVDAGNSPVVARNLLSEMKAVGLPEVSKIIYTHHHWDHIYGACAVQAPVIAHRKCRSILIEEAKKPWSSVYLDELADRNPQQKVSCEARQRAVQDWDSFEIIIPGIDFDDNRIIHHEGIRIELEHVGGEHAEDSIVVKLPQESIMFIGDCYYPPPLHLRTPDSTISADMLASLIDEDYDLYIEGHDDPLERKDIIDYLHEVGYRPV